MMLADFHEGLKGALPWWTLAAVAGVLAAVLYYLEKWLVRKYPHLKREKPPKRKKRG